MIIGSRVSYSIISLVAMEMADTTIMNCFSDIVLEEGLVSL